jgi:hypothetical protein
MGDLQAMTIPELEGTIDALLTRAGAVSPPHSIIEAEEQATVLRQLARVRDEVHRRARAREGSALADMDRTPSRGRRRRAGATTRRTYAAARVPSEDQVDAAILRLEALAQRARDNLVRQGRDPGGARVAMTWWQEAVGVHGARFRVLVATLERRGLVQIDGAFVSSAGGAT